VTYLVVKEQTFLPIGAFIVAIGVMFLNAGHLLIGGTVGLGILLHYMTNESVSFLIFCLNIPFYLLALPLLGMKFTAKTFVSVCFLSFFSTYVPYLFPLEYIHPLIGALLGGSLLGFGMAILLAHQSSIGGITIVAVLLQKRYDIKSKTTILYSDALIVGSSIILIDIHAAFYSIIAIIMTNIALEQYKKINEKKRA
jgi:uncharacterized membrane-anchored protein YitT (DUF2179 family)